MGCMIRGAKLEVNTLRLKKLVLLAEVRCLQSLDASRVRMLAELVLLAEVSTTSRVNEARDSVMSSASSAVTYTSVYTDFEPGRVFWGANEELSDGGSPRVIVYGYNGLHMQLVAPPSSDYVPGPEHLPSTIEVPYVPKLEYPEYLVPSDDEARMEDNPLPVDASPVALSPCYVADSDPEEDPEEDHVDYPADGGDDNDEPSDDDDDDDDTGDEDEEPFKEEEDDEEEEEHLAPADSPAVPVIDPAPSAEDTEAFEIDEAAPTHVPSPTRHTARMYVRPQTPIPLPSEAEIERLLALPIPPPSPLTPLSSPLPQISSPPLLLQPYHTLTTTCTHIITITVISTTTITSLTIHTTSRPYEVGESLTASPRPTRGHRTDYGFIDTMDAEDRQTQIYQRVDILAEDRQFHYETARLLDQEALVSREAWAHSIGLSSAVHYELQAYRTHTQMQDYRIASQESLMMTFIAQVSSLQGQLSVALGQIQALQTRGQTHADDRIAIIMLAG
ncbi:hypothetical protein Tco_1569412 [Tanacetum coccineum]